MLQRRALLLAPFVAVAATGVGFYTVLGRMQTGRFDPHEVPSQLIDRPVPAFTLPGQDLEPGFSSADLARAPRPTLLNFFASWCVPCMIEHPELMTLASEGLPIWGIAYKDTSTATAGFITRHGNPYARVARDMPGRVAIDFGVYGVPESYLVDRTGVVRWHYPGPLTPEVVDQRLRPLLKVLG